MQTAAQTGQYGESAVLGLLQRRGWRVTGQNVRRGRMEADLVATRLGPDGRELLIAEVKSARLQPRQSRHRGRPVSANQNDQDRGASVQHPQSASDLVERLSKAQRSRLWQMAEMLAAQHQAPVVRVALIAVLLGQHRSEFLWVDLTWEEPWRRR
jgi:Holliday junction resolvase-like predicted endonuclease